MILENFRYWLASKIIGQPIRENKEVWKLVHTDSIILNVKGYQAEKGEVHYFFYESNLGNRRHKVKCTHQFFTDDNLAEYHHRSKVYLERIIPWEAGRYVSGIPGFLEVDSIDVIAKLSVG